MSAPTSISIASVREHVPAPLVRGPLLGAVDVLGREGFVLDVA